MTTIATFADFADLAALIAAHGITPISAHWTDNPDGGGRRWHVKVATCGDFDRLAADLPTPADLTGTHRDPFTGRIGRYHATADGELIHLCRCTPDEKGALL